MISSECTGNVSCSPRNLTAVSFQVSPSFQFEFCELGDFLSFGKLRFIPCGL